MNYQQLTESERYQIYVMKKPGIPSNRLLGIPESHMNLEVGSVTRAE